MLFYLILIALTMNERFEGRVFVNLFCFLTLLRFSVIVSLWVLVEIMHESCVVICL